ncbi:MAG: hypothetical protein ACLPKW_07900 [Acetobacteraceae bacterium]
MTTEKESALRAFIGKLLADGLKTLTEPFPETNREFGNLLVALRELPPDDLEAKLVLSGFTDRPYGPDQMRCQECMYYLAPQMVRPAGARGTSGGRLVLPALADLAAPC